MHLPLRCTTAECQLFTYLLRCTTVACQHIPTIGKYNSRMSTVHLPLRCTTVVSDMHLLFRCAVAEYQTCLSYYCVQQQSIKYAPPIIVYDSTVCCARNILMYNSRASNTHLPLQCKTVLYQICIYRYSVKQYSVKCAPPITVCYRRVRYALTVYGVLQKSQICSYCYFVKRCTCHYGVQQKNQICTYRLRCATVECQKCTYHYCV